MGKTLYDKVFDRHVVRQVSANQYQIAIGLHLVNELSSPQAFEGLTERGLSIRYPSRTFCTADHSVSTSGRPDDFADEMAALQVATLAQNAKRHALRYFDPERGEHGIMHVVAPERGLVWPGMLVVCGDSHTSTHGAMGALAFGIGTSQVRDVLASQTMLAEKLKVRRIEVTGRLSSGVYAKDVALYLIRQLGVQKGIGYAHEFGGEVVTRFSIEERMTLCNLAVEGGARCGYVNPDAVTYEYLSGREYAPKGDAWQRVIAEWEQVKSDPGASYDDVVFVDANAIEPMVTWGITPEQCIAIGEPVPDATTTRDQAGAAEALNFMGLRPGQSMKGVHIDVAFLGSCTNGRLSDFEAAADGLRRGSYRVASHVRALVVPGSRAVRNAMIEKGLDRLFHAAGFDVRDSGCSLCCGMNSDSLVGAQTCASSSNRNFKGRQGSPTGRTILMSPVMVAAAAVTGEITDARALFRL